MENRIILKTTPEGEAVRATELNSIRVDLKSNAISYTESQVIIDKMDEEYQFENAQSRFSVNFSPESGTDPVKAARAQAAAQAVFEIFKNYHLECVAEELAAEGGQS